MTHPNKERRSPARAQERGGSHSSACGALGSSAQGSLGWRSRPAGEAAQDTEPSAMQSLAGTLSGFTGLQDHPCAHS